MRRRLLNVATALSGLVCVLAAAMWVWSRPMMRLDSVGRMESRHHFSAISGGGRFAVSFGSSSVPQQAYGWAWQHERDTYGFEPAYPPTATILGLGWRTLHMPRRFGPAGTWTETTVVVPYWQVGVAGAILPAWRGWSRVRTRRRRAPGRCGACGYDLTGNVSGVCPECGGARA